MSYIYIQESVHTYVYRLYVHTGFMYQILVHIYKSLVLYTYSDDLPTSLQLWFLLLCTKIVYLQ